MSNYFKIFSILICSLPMLTLGKGNDIKFDHLTPEDGLSNKEVRVIMEDSRGFMWFGTLDGLNRYDGYTIKTYRHDPQDSTTLSGNCITSLYENSNGDIWIAAGWSGLSIYDREQDKFFIYYFNNDKNIAVSNFYEDGQGELWMSSNLGIARMGKDEYGNHVYDKYEIISEYQPGGRNNIVRDHSNNLWLGCNVGLYKYNINTKQIDHYPLDPDNPNDGLKNRVWALHMGSGGILWLATFRGLYSFNPQTENMLYHDHSSTGAVPLSWLGFTDIYEDHHGSLWMTSYSSGLFKFDKQTMEFTLYENDPWDETSLGDNCMWCGYLDRSGAHWIGTTVAGVAIYNPNKEKFNTVQLKGQPCITGEYEVLSLYEDHNDTLWIGTDFALIKYNLKTGEFRCIDYQSSKMFHSKITKMYEDNEGILWISTSKDGLYSYDLQNRKLRQYLYDAHNPYLPDFKINWPNTIVTFIEDYTGIMRLITWRQGVMISLDKKTGRFLPFKMSFEDFESKLLDIGSLCEDHFGKFWLGTGDGLRKLSHDLRTMQVYKHDPANPGSISSDAVNVIHEDKSGTIWIGTRNGGLNRFDQGKDSFEQYKSDDGLASDHVMSILEDDAGCLWLATEKGISSLKYEQGGILEKPIIRNYDFNDGITIRFVRIGISYKGRDGRLYFGGFNGFVSFHPEELRHNTRIPPIVVTDFKIFDKSVPVETHSNSPLQRAISESDEIVLSHNQNFFSFEFAALDYTVPQKNQYAYMLEGLDTDWIYSGNRRFANYTDVDPGEYVFRVKGSNNDALWNEEGRSIKIIITPPWWRTVWAYIIYIILFGTAVYSIWRFQINRMRMKQKLQMEHMHAEKLEEIDRMKSRFFANISHEFRTPLTLILGPIEKLFHRIEDAELKQEVGMLERNAVRLQNLINQLLDLSKLEAGKMQLEARLLDMVPVIKNIVLSFISLAESKNVTLKFKSDYDSIDIYLDRDKFEKIMFNLLSNAFKFTPDNGKIDVFVAVVDGSRRMERHAPTTSSLSRGDTGECIQITVSNTGPGIPADKINKIFDRFYQADDSYTKEHEGTGIGLALVKELVELHHGTIDVKCDGTARTTFTVQLPLGREHLSHDEIVEYDMEVGMQHTASLPATPLFPPLARGDDTGAEYAYRNGTVQTSKPKTPSPKSKPVILIVEDNRDMRYYLNNKLFEEYRIIEAAEGKQGLKKAISKIPDLIISDIMMPKMDGFQLCHKLKTDERTSHIPVILLTARADAESKIEGLETGADDYITKPFSARELQVRVRNLIEQRRKLRERYQKDSAIEPRDIAVTPLDERFLNRSIDIIEEHMADSSFTVNEFIREIGMSRTQLHRKMHALTNQSTLEFIRSYRLKRAAQLLEKKHGNVTQVAYEVGFENPAYFAKCFRKQFGSSPSEYIA